MALSQKYTGKVLVPWFNTSEWRTVHRLVCSHSQDDHKTALDVLKIWKTRTPLLSAGIEGTLILLEARHSDLQALSESQIVQIYSVSLLRFLNVCAANNERQGTFAESIARTDLPKWLIDIRHDIAHDNKLPSRSLLEIGIRKSFEWLIKSYWEAQNRRICDFSVSDETEAEDMDLMEAFIRLINTDEIDEATINNIKKLIGNRHSYSNIDKDGLLSLLEEALSRFYDDWSNIGKRHKQLKMLVGPNAMLGVKLDTNEGQDIINKESRDTWTNVLNIIFSHGLIFTLLKELYKILNDVLQPDKSKLISALWIKEVVEGLLELILVRKKLFEISVLNVLQYKSPRSTARAQLEEENEKFGSCLKFDDPEIVFAKEAREFRYVVLSSPNIHSRMFLNSLLRLTDCSVESTKRWSELAQLYLEPLTNVWEDEIMTANHIDGHLAPVESQDRFDEPMNFTDDDDESSNLRMSNKWERIQDTRPFERCPLGLLPHQSATANPTILF